MTRFPNPSSPWIGATNWNYNQCDTQPTNRTRAWTRAPGDHARNVLSPLLPPPQRRHRCESPQRSSAMRGIPSTTTSCSQRNRPLFFRCPKERLWNAAYDSLETENAELVLSAVFRANPGVAPDTKISAELHGSTRRQIQINPAPSRTVRCPTELVGEHQRHLG